MYARERETSLISELPERQCQGLFERGAAAIEAVRVAAVTYTERG